MAFRNRIRLPLQLHSAQFPEERQIFRKANGQTKTMSVVVRKTYELETDYMPEHWHQRLKIALAHDEVIVEGERYLGTISQDGDYNIEWPEGVLHYPTAKAGVKIQVTPFDATNANCQTCEEVNQLDLENDEATGIYGALQEDQDYAVSAADNDSICCYPAVFSLTSFNSDYLTSASIDPDTGEFTFHTGTGLASANGLIIAIYRVTCPDGSYDEANIIADIEGSTPGACLQSTGLTLEVVSTDSLGFVWTPPAPTPDGYEWELYLGSLPIGTPVATGTETLPQTDSITGLDPGTEYYFQLRSVCDESYSSWAGITASTIEGSNSCGEYTITNTNTDPPGFRNITYTNCAGTEVTTPVINQNDLIICALQYSAGDPVQINTPLGVNISYEGLC